MRTRSSLVGQLTSYHLITCLTVCWEGELSFFWETAVFLQLEGRFEAGTAQHSVVYSNTIQWDHNTANWLGLVVFTKTGFHWIALTFSSFTSTSVGRIGLDRGFMSKILAFNTFISLVFHLVRTRSFFFFIYPSVSMKDKLSHNMESLAWCCCKKYPYPSFRGFQLTPSPPTFFFNYMTFEPVLLFPCPSHSWKQIKLVNKDVFYIVKGMWQRTKSGSLWTIKPVRFRLWYSITEVHKTLW